MYKYKRNGFTLVELMAVIIIISLIAILTFPNIVNQIKKTKKSNNKMVEDLVLTQAKKYVSDNPSEFEDDDGYCLSIDTLVDKGYVNEQLVDINNKDTDVIMMLKKDDFSYKIVNKNDCDVSEYQKIFVDNEGKKYERVEYLESTGTQYIDTGVKVDNTIKVDTSLSITSNQDQHIFGVRQAYLQNAFGFSRQDGTVVRFAYGNNQKYDDGSVNVLDYNTYTFDTNKVYINNNQKYVFNENDIQGNLNMYVFTINNNGSPFNQYSYIRMEYFKLWKGGVLVRDYIPVIDKDERPCFFDKVSKECYYNKGSGEFRYPHGIIPVNYLQSTGSQFIDTKITVDNTIKVDTSLSITSTQDQHIFGVRQAYLQNAFGFSRQEGGVVRFAYGNNQQYDDKSIVLSDFNSYVFDKNNIYINNNQKYVFNENDIQGNLNMYIFAVNNNGSAFYQYSYIKMKYFKLWKGNILVRDYIPALDEDDRPCLYDRVEKKCYYNQGTGEFLYG